MTAPIQVSVADFDLANGMPIGVGALAQVLKVRHIPSGSFVACKVLSKIQLLQSKKVEAVMKEKEALIALGPHPQIARLLGTAQSDDELYFFLELLPNGDLQEHISRITRLRRGPDSPIASTWLPNLFCLTFSDLRLIAAQLVLALEHCHTDISGRHHSCFVIRDVKSENICFDKAGRCVLIDFDCVDQCKGLEPESNFGDALGETQRQNESSAAASLRRKTISSIQESRKMSAYNFCGTAQFVSPEVLGQLRWSYSSDLWALGVVVYQMLFGRYPFNGDGPFGTMKEIIKGLNPATHFPAPAAVASSNSNALYTEEQYAFARDFIEALLVIDPTKRLGVGRSLAPDFEALRAHPLFTMSTTKASAAALLPPVDWRRLRYQLGLPLDAARGGGPATMGYTYSPLTSTGQGSIPSGPPYSIIGLYDDPPFHDENYTSHANDICSGAGPLEEALVAKMESAVGVEENVPAAGGNANFTAQAPAQMDKEYTTTQCSEIINWLQDEWAQHYFHTRFTSQPSSVSAAPSLSTSMSIRERLLSKEVMKHTESAMGPHLAGLKVHWKQTSDKLGMAAGATGTVDNSPLIESVEGLSIPGPITSTVQPDKVQGHLAHAARSYLTLELAFVDRLVAGHLASTAAMIEAQQREAARIAEDQYLDSVAEGNARRKAEGISVPLGVNNPYAPYSSKPITISDLKSAIREAEEAEREDRQGDCDDVIDDVGADRYGALQKPDSDFSQ